MKYLSTDDEAKVILWVSVKTPGRVKVLFGFICQTKKKKNGGSAAGARLLL